jgi:molybdopterin-guanine dinucleotide biosynthesis protein A
MRVVDRVFAAVEGIADDVILSANAPEAAQWMPGTRVVADIHAGTGGLAGVHAALVHQDGADVLAVAWDMPFVTVPLLELLQERLVGSGADVCVPESVSPHGIEPFCACYSAAVRGRLDAFLRGGGGAAREFLTQCVVERVTRAQLSALGDPATLFLSVNDALDLERARVLGR